MSDKVAPPVATPEAVAELRKQAESEWGTYVALADIEFNGTPAYRAGSPVPASNVARYKYDEQGLVAKVTTAAAQNVVRAIHETGQEVTGPVVVEPVSISVPVKS